MRLHKKSPVISGSDLTNALSYAAMCNRLSIMKQLMSIPKIDINQCNEDDSPLGLACKYGNEKTVQLLLCNRNIKVDFKNDKEMTPLMIACESSYTHKNPALFKMLLASGADITLTNSDGETAYDIAKKHNNQAALNVLRGAMTSFLNYSFFKTKPKSSQVVDMSEQNDTTQLSSFP